MSASMAQAFSTSGVNSEGWLKCILKYKGWYFFKMDLTVGSELIKSFLSCFYRQYDIFPMQNIQTNRFFFHPNLQSKKIEVEIFQVANTAAALRSIVLWMSQQCY